MRLDPDQGVLVFTDGSAATSDRSGGWAYVALDAYSGLAEDSGGVTDTTISRMELQAPTEALEMLAREYGACEVLIKSDSQYVVRGFMDKSRARRANVDMWDRLEAAAALHVYVEMAHVRGHKGHVWNERADVLAGKARRGIVSVTKPDDVNALMERATEKLSPQHREKLLDSILLVALEKREFTADDVWAHSGVPETRGIGSLMVKAARSGWCEKAGYVPKESAQGGRWQFTLWRSLVCEA